MCTCLPGGGVMGHHALIIEFHIKFETANFTEQHVPFIHH